MANQTFRLNKLVRDGIPESNRQAGGRIELTRLEGPEKIHALADKIIEEAVEFCAEGKDHKKRARELAQMYGIIRAIASEMGMTIAEIEAIEDVKRDELGAYDEGYFVKTVTLPEENEWAEYYRSQPDRFPIVVE